MTSTTTSNEKEPSWSSHHSLSPLGPQIRGLSPPCPRVPRPRPTRSPGHLIGDVVHGQVVERCGVVAVQQDMQEGSAVPAGHIVSGCAQPEPSPISSPQLPRPTSGRWDRGTRGLWGGNPWHTAASSTAGSQWAQGQSQSAGDKEDQDHERHGLPAPSSASPTSPSPWPHRRPRGVHTVEHVTSKSHTDYQVGGIAGVQSWKEEGHIVSLKGGFPRPPSITQLDLWRQPNVLFCLFLY